MRYKFLACAFLLLISTPFFGQESSPIVIETGKSNPSVVKSGEPFKITYRAKFVDTVLIDEKQMQSSNLALEKIEVIDLKIEPKKREYNDSLGYVNVWDFTYTFMIIQSEKDLYKIPPFNFIWFEKIAGVSDEETREREKPREFLTDEVGIGYISTVNPANKTIKPPPLDIRDEIIFSSPVGSGLVLRRWAYGVIGTALLFSGLIILRFPRNLKARKSQEISGESVADIVETGSIADVEQIIPPKQARKRFLAELEKMGDGGQLNKIRFLVRMLLLSELRGIIKNSMTENEIYAKLNDLDAKQKKQVGSKYQTMFYLARLLKNYQENIDSGINPQNYVVATAEFKEAVSALMFHKKVLSFVKRLVSRRG